MKKIIILFLCTSISILSQVKVSTYSGTKDTGLVNGSLKDARYNKAFGICLDKKGSLFIAENGNSVIRKIDVKGNVTTLAGSGKIGTANGAGDKAEFNEPAGVCADDKGNVYVADFVNHLIRKIDIHSIVTTVAGNGKPGYKDGKGTEAQFNYPRGVCIDKKGNLYVSDSWNHRIRKIDTEGNVTTFAGGGNYFDPDSRGTCVDGRDTTARFYTPCGMAIDDKGNIYVTDARNHRIRKIDTKGFVTTLAGSSEGGVDKGGFRDGKAETSFLNTPTEVCAGKNGEVYFSDTYGNRIRKIYKGMVSTIAGTGKAGFTDGPGTSAQFNFPRGIALDKTGKKIYVFDYNNSAVRLVELK
jgi:DNA-binding beta-propeller fold protein YncE